MADFEIIAGGFTFKAVYNPKAPKTVEAFKKHLLGMKTQVIQARWSGRSGWVPFGDLDLGVEVEWEVNTSYPAAGELLIYGGGESEAEVLFPYGHTAFHAVTGQLAGNHFATIVEGNENLEELGRKMLWEGAQDLEFRAI